MKKVKGEGVCGIYKCGLCSQRSEQIIGTGSKMIGSDRFGPNGSRCHLDRAASSLATRLCLEFEPGASRMNGTSHRVLTASAATSGSQVRSRGMFAYQSCAALPIGIVF